MNVDVIEYKNIIDEQNIDTDSEADANVSDHEFDIQSHVRNNDINTNININEVSTDKYKVKKKSIIFYIINCYNNHSCSLYYYILFVECNLELAFNDINMEK
jgi:hypothetical protein